MRLIQTIILCSVCFFSSYGQSNEITSTHRQAANQLESQAVERIDLNDTEGGLALFQKALESDPTPLRHMNYGSLLFGHGVEEFKAGNKDKAFETLFEAQDHLSNAILGFDPKKDGVFLAQCNFLLGEMYFHAFNDVHKASMFYEKALSYSPHKGAKEALRKIQ
jgi:tetratricopeptide (TPR) repeat protein